MKIRGDMAGFMNPNYEIWNALFVLAFSILISSGICRYFKINPLWGVGAVVLIFMILQICIRVSDARWEKEQKKESE